MTNSSCLPPPTAASEDASHGAHDDDLSHTMKEQSVASAHQSCLTLLRNALRNPDQLTAMISNYSTSYNAVNVGIVLPVLNYSIQSKAGDEAYSSPSGATAYEEAASLSTSLLVFSKSVMSSIARRRLDDNGNNNNDEEDDEQDSIVASSLLAGMIFGQLIGGFLGDVLGRRNAMMLVMILQIGGSLGSAIFITTDNSAVEGLTTLEQLAIWRFILGIGAGGVYPLAAVMSAENKRDGGGLLGEEEDEDNVAAVNDAGQESQQANGINGEQDWNDEEDDDCHRAGNMQNGGHAVAAATAVESSANSNSDSTINSFQRIALTFSTQGLGFLTVPLLAYPMLEFRWNIDAIWRTLLGVGALPGLLVLYLRFSSVSLGGCKSNDNGKVELAFENTMNGNESISDNSSIDKTSPNNPSTRKNEGGGTSDGSLSPTLQSAVSTLFNDTTVSDSENEMALVENSHLEIDIEDDDKHTDNDDSACDDIPTTPTRKNSRGLWESIRAEPNLGRKFAGTAGTWFLFDVLFYGNTLFEPFVLEAAFGSHSADATDNNDVTNGYELLQTTVRDSLVISLLSLPGYFVTVLLIGRRTTCSCLLSSSSTTRCGSVASCLPCYQTPAYIQMQGFFLMFLLYIIIGLFWSSLKNIQWLLLVLYAGTFFFANYGPNTTTFLLPSVTYSEECRSTLNGISAAAGKVGALVGAMVFEPAADMWGESVVMVCCGCVSLIAWTLTKLCLGGGKNNAV